MHYNKHCNRSRSFGAHRYPCKHPYTHVLFKHPKDTAPPVTHRWVSSKGQPPPPPPPHPLFHPTAPHLPGAPSIDGTRRCDLPPRCGFRFPPPCCCGRLPTFGPVFVFRTCMTPTFMPPPNFWLKFSSRLRSSSLKYFISSSVCFTWGDMCRDGERRGAQRQGAGE